MIWSVFVGQQRAQAVSKRIDQCKQNCRRNVNVIIAIQRLDIHMKRFIQGEDRTQSTLLPEALDDYITENNPVRVIDVYVDNLDLGKLGFEGVEPEATGRPAYHPATLLKLYIYGYLNRIQSEVGWKKWSPTFL